MGETGREEMARRLEPALLRPDVTLSEVESLCRLAKTEPFPAVVVEPFFVSDARRFLAGTKVGVATVVGFPFGATTAETKHAEAAQSLVAGATDIDAVMNLSAFKSELHDYVAREVASLAELVHGFPGRILKVILETGYLKDEEIRDASLLVVDAGADFVKTCTGFGPRGVAVEDIVIIREAIGNRARIKAAGGVSSRGFAEKLLVAGADRIGTSRPLDILG